MPVSGRHSNWLAGIDSHDLVAYNIFTAPNRTSAHISIPMSILIDPGHYSLVFGSGLFGAIGSGVMPATNPANLNQQSFIGWWEITSGRWQWSTQLGAYQGMSRRFVVEGYAMPEPGSAIVIISAVLLCTVFRPRALH
jgi:hypothetical protein